MHFLWNINVGEVTTLLISLGTFVYFMGRLTQNVEDVSAAHQTLKGDFTEHCNQNVEQFDNVRRDLAIFASNKKGSLS